MHKYLPMFAVVMLTGCQYNPYAHLFTTTKPKDADIAGSYVLTDQTITPGRLSILRQQCHLDLLPDGSFRLTNYPTWSEAFSTNSGRFIGVTSTTGRWNCTTTGTVSDGRTSKEHWGVAFSDTGQKVEALNLTGKAPPYGLIMTYGDGDAGAVMILKKR